MALYEATTTLQGVGTEYIPECHDHTDVLWVSHDLRGGSEPPHRITAVGCNAGNCTRFMYHIILHRVAKEDINKNVGVATTNTTIDIYNMPRVP